MDQVVNPIPGEELAVKAVAPVSPAWAAQLKDDLKSNEFLTKFESVSDLGKYALEADGKLKNMVILPGEGAKDEEVSAFFTKLGKPESPDKYEIVKPADWPTEVPYDENAEKWFRDLAFKNHLSAKQASSIHKEYMVGLKNAFIAEDTRKKTELATLLDTMKKEWGDNWRTNIALMDRAMDKFGDPEFKTFMDESGFGNNPHMIRIFHKIGLSLAEDTFVKGEEKKTTPTGTAGQLSYPSLEGKK